MSEAPQAVTGAPQEAWWTRASAISRAWLKGRGVTLPALIADLDRLAGLGIDAIEVFAPCAGGTAYGGLDTIDFYAVDPALGTRADLEELIAEAHRRGMAIVLFLNLGYSHEEFPAFLKACGDVRAGVDSPESRWFVWSRSGQDTMERPLAPFFLNDTDGKWHWSDRAQSHYWVKWEGEKGGYNLPQFNFADPGWQAEARRILDFWLDLGVDGIVTDAVNWYIGCDWKIVREVITDPINSRGALLNQPEGAGGFNDDPLPWVTQGGFNCLMDYSLALWWENTDVVGTAVAQSDARPIEQALAGFRDRVVAAGGFCYTEAEGVLDLPPDGHLLRAVTVATVGQLVLDLEHGFGKMLPDERERLAEVLRARRRFAALGATGERQPIDTGDDGRTYAFVRQLEGRTPVLVVLNFDPQPRLIDVPLTDWPTTGLANILTGERITAGQSLVVDLPGHGFGLYAFE